MIVSTCSLHIMLYFSYHYFVARIKGKYGPAKEINLLYEDQAINDFKTLFLRIHGKLMCLKSLVGSSVSKQGDNVLVASVYLSVCPSVGQHTHA